MARIGEIIDGKYEILREIGRGGMSVVYLAMDKRLNKQWAIKEFRKDKDDASKEVALKALLDEANLMKKLDHPTLPRIVDIIDVKTSVYIVMDYIEGESLNKVLDATGAQPQDAVIEWAKQLSDVLDYLHTQNPPVIYRDMKPANIMLKPDGTVRLIDFGIAREYKEGKEGDTEAIGTRGYAAPEQFGGHGQTDARTDIYSLGVTLYHLVTGKNPAEPPYEIYPIRHWNPSLSSGLEWLIQKCTQLNPSDRYQSCAEVTYVLENLDKFDVEYKKKQQRRIRTFWSVAAATCVFAAISAACFIGANRIKNNNYNAFLSKTEPIEIAEAITVDEKKNDAYVKIANELDDKVYTIVVQEKSINDGYTVDEADIIKWFSPNHLETIKQNSVEDYARINFILGKLYFNNYFSGNKDDVTAGFNKAKQYFSNVICSQGGENPGLEPSEWNLAKMYFTISYLSMLKSTDEETGRVHVTDPAAEFIELEGIKDGNTSNTMPALWSNCKKLLEEMSDLNDNDLRPLAKIKTLERVVVVLDMKRENIYNTNEISGEDVRAMFELLVSSLHEIDRSSDSVKARCDKVADLIDMAKAGYQTKFNISLEEIVP